MQVNNVNAVNVAQRHAQALVGIAQVGACLALVRVVDVVGRALLSQAFAEEATADFAACVVSHGTLHLLIWNLP